MATMIACDYTAFYTSMAINAMTWIPWVVSGLLYAWYIYSSDGAFQLLSYFTFLSSLPLYPAQTYFNDLRVDPFCNAFTHYVFPNMEISCLASVIVFIIFFRWWYKVSVSWFQYLLIVAFVALPLFIHVHVAGLSVWKVVASASWGGTLAIAYCPLLWTSQKSLAYLFSIYPFYTWYRESFLLRDDASLNVYRRLRRWNDERAQQSRSASYSWGAFSILSSRHVVWVDYVPTDYASDVVLWDLGFLVIPNDLPKWGADIALGLLVSIGLARLTFVPLPDGQSHLEIWTRFGFVWGIMYYLRGFTVGLTRFPRLLPTGPIPHSDGLGWALLSIVSGDHPSESDFMFSGHTATMTLMGLFVSYYTFRHFFSHLYWLLVLGGYWAIIAARIHYTADVMVAIIVSILVFTLFHAVADPDWLSGWRSTLTVTMPGNVEFTLPIRLVDGASPPNEWVVHPPNGAGGLGYLRVGRYSTPYRRSFFSNLVHLLGGH